MTYTFGVLSGDVLSGTGVSLEEWVHDQNCPCRPAPAAKRWAPAWLSPVSAVALPSANSLAIAWGKGSPTPSQAERRSLRTQRGGNAAIERASASASSRARPAGN